VWTYFRHYLNLWILWSVYHDFDLIPVAERTLFDPLNGKWMDWWMKWQIFTPIALLQCLNLFWYFLIWRILFRVVFLNIQKDERSDDEDDSEEPAKAVDGTDKAE
jgi:acyl-CoA-dependent ceramide synthase